MIPDYLTPFVVIIFLASATVMYRFFMSGRSGGRINQWVEKPKVESSSNSSAGDISAQRTQDSPEFPLGVETLSRIEDGDRILSLVFLADGRRVASLCRDDSKIHLWNTDDGKLEKSSLLIGHKAKVNTMAISRDGKWIVSGDNDGFMVVWKVKADSVQNTREFKAAEGGKISTLDISPDSLRVATGSSNGTMVVCSMEDLKRILGPLESPGFSNPPVSSVKFSPAGGHMASSHFESGRSDCSIQLWNSLTGAKLKSIECSQATYSLAWSLDGHRLFGGGSNGSIKCFDVRTRALSTLDTHSTRSPVISLCSSNSGQLLVSVSKRDIDANGTLHIRSIQPGACELLYSCNDVVLASISPDASRLISVGKDNAVTLWSLSCPPRLETDADSVVHPGVAPEACQSGDLEEPEENPSKEDWQQLNSDPLVKRALRWIQREKWDNALQAVQVIKEQSKNAQATLLAYLIEGTAYYRKGQSAEARKTFQSTLAHHVSNAEDLVKCVKLLTFAANDSPDNNLRQLVELLLLTRDSHIGRPGYEQVLKSVLDISQLVHRPEAKTISLIFDRDLHCLMCDVHELRCRALSETGQCPHSEVFSYFPVHGTDLSEELAAIKAECSLLSEEFGDEAVRNEKHKKAIAWYSEALILGGFTLTNKDVTTPEGVRKDTAFSRCPHCIAHLLAKRSEVNATMCSWEDALPDAIRAVEIDSSYPWGHERKFVALHALEKYEAATSTLNIMFSNFMDTYALEISTLRNYSETIKKINEQIITTFDKAPFVLIDVTNGGLYKQEERRSMFEKDPKYHELVSLMSTKPDPDYIKKVVDEYFSYVMFSHTWEGEEPSSEQVVSKGSVYKLGPSPQNQKLRTFCETVRDVYKPYRWSWSDTCCINKADRDIYDKSIRFMYKWYHNSAFTLVLLADPNQSTPRGSALLKDNRWMFRAWTLQELLAPEDIRFYSRDWKPKFDRYRNNKALTEIEELRDAMSTIPVTLKNFTPESLTVRQRLSMASTRQATVRVDIAYALIGIFNSDIHVEYTREAEVALGLLLQEIVDRQGDVTVLDWIGKSSRFNSCIPYDISVYNPGHSSHKLSQVTDDTVKERAEGPNAPLKGATNFYNLLSTLGLPRFANRRLSLPCITFVIDDIKCNAATTYTASTAALGPVSFRTVETPFSELKEGRVVLVYPWTRDLLAEIRRGKDKQARAWRLIICLEQAFRALLFVEQSHQRYKRVATDKEIIVPPRELASLEDVTVETLEIWEKS